MSDDYSAPLQNTLLILGANGTVQTSAEFYAERTKAIAQQIAQQETAGGTTGVGASKNNPGGLTWAPWEAGYGGTQTGTFTTFPTLSGGFDALNALVDKYIKGGASITSMMNKYAPVAQNPTTPFRIQSLTDLTGLDPNLPILQQLQLPGISSQSQAAIDAFNKGANPSTTIAPESQAAIDAHDAEASFLGMSIPIARFATGVIGLVLFTVGLLMLRQVQTMAVNIGGNVKKAAELAALVA